MISNVYYPLNVKQYKFNPNKLPQNAGESNINPDASGNKNNQIEVETQPPEVAPSNNSRCFDKFMNSEDPVIHILDIVKDIKGTMTHLGVPREIGNVAIQDLKDIQNEANKENPSISVVQGKLFKIADSIDQFVSSELGQPSTVIRQWVDSILMQKIDYQAAKTKPAAIPATPKTDPTNLSNVSMEIAPQFKGNTQISPEQSIEPAAIRTSIEVNNVKDIIPDPPSKTTSKTISSTPKSALEIFTPTSSPFTATIRNQQTQTESAKQSYLKARRAFVNQDYNQASTLYKTALQKAQSENNTKVISRTYADLAEIDDSNFNTKGALKNYHQAIRFASQDNNNIKFLGKLHYNVGSIYDELNLPGKALEHYHASLGFDGEAGNLSGQALTLNNVASLQLYNNDINSALESYEMAYTLAQEANDKEGQSHILSNMGSLFKKQENHIQALEFFRKSLNIDNEQNNTEGYSQNLLNIGDIYHFTGQKDRAIKYFNNALNNGIQLNDNNLIQQAQYRLNTTMAI